MKVYKRTEGFSRWYQDVIKAAKLAAHSGVRGCMVIRPEGFAIWEGIQRNLDQRFKETGHVNAYFPLFIPKSFLSKEAEHIEGFAKECAVVTHYRLKNDENGNGLVVDPTARLEEELIVRPTSETIIWNTYRDWITSYRDLPILVNQWANVVRWEMRTRLFLRTAEFLWQEGHTAHATAQEADFEAKQMLAVYKDFAENVLAIPVFTGRKTAAERFPGAVETYTIEGMMQDKKALQMGTSHDLGQTFAKAFDVTFTNKNGEQEHVWATSWGVSTRLIGALIMTHSDDKGLVLPPKLATTKVVIIPIFKKDNQKEVRDYVTRLARTLRASGIAIQVDDRDNYRVGYKFNEHEQKGVPLRLEVGSKEVNTQTVVCTRRDTGTKKVLGIAGISFSISALLEQIQQDLLTKARQLRDTHTFRVKSYNEMQVIIQQQQGFAQVFWEGSEEDEEALKAFNGSIRCIIEDTTIGQCIVTGKQTTQQVLIAKSY